ncbi:hypothetical protein P7K49_027487 [Saguinus oedipus]|uniref:Uncharacterized protein n=1 Tax=Saguinus oedipus TaxID=9490 RepID=A0ABQ9U9K8_SAGOE|nr:hypothetical protein P7K49_027487 [Saguinus oedipus]
MTLSHIPHVPGPGQASTLPTGHPRHAPSTLSIPATIIQYQQSPGGTWKGYFSKVIRQRKARRKAGEAKPTPGTQRPRTLPGSPLRVLTRPPGGASPSACQAAPWSLPVPWPPAGSGRVRPGAVPFFAAAQATPRSRVGLARARRAGLWGSASATDAPTRRTVPGRRGSKPDSPEPLCRLPGLALAAAAADDELSLLRDRHGLGSTSSSGSRGASRDPGGGERRRRRRRRQAAAGGRAQPRPSPAPRRGVGPAEAARARLGSHLAVAARVPHSPSAVRP